MKIAIIIFLILSINVCAFAQKDNPKVLNDSLMNALTYDALSDKDIDLKVGNLISNSGAKQRKAFISGVIGAGAGLLIGLVTYDKDKKTISPVSFLPPLIAGIVSIVYFLSGVNDLDEAGKLMMYKAMRDKK